MLIIKMLKIVVRIKLRRHNPVRDTIVWFTVTHVIRRPWQWHRHTRQIRKPVKVRRHANTGRQVTAWFLQLVLRLNELLSTKSILITHTASDATHTQWPRMQNSLTWLDITKLTFTPTLSIIRMKQKIRRPQKITY